MINKSILVTGGCGFIGSNIVERLLSMDVKKVRVLDNLSTGDMKNINFLLKKYEKIGKLEFIKGDICDIEICRLAVKGIDMICHQAALGSVPRSVSDPLNSHLSNVNGFFNILLAAKENNIKRVVYASSSSVYGDEKELPKIENKTGNLLSPYAATKAIDEIYGWIFHHTYGMECIGLRYFNVFGYRQNPRGAYAAVIPKFIELILKNERPKIYGDGTYSRDFTFIDNVVSANILALQTEDEKSFGKAINIGAGGRVTILHLYETIKKILNYNKDPIFVENRVGDIPHSNANISLAKELIGYKPRVNFEEGIKKTVNHYVKNFK
jgi:UDP-N-acetylglucosamine 4-epimerase